jgi:hypothetical protein
MHYFPPKTVEVEFAEKATHLRNGVVEIVDVLPSNLICDKPSNRLFNTDDMAWSIARAWRSFVTSLKPRRRKPSISLWLGEGDSRKYILIT